MLALRREATTVKHEDFMEGIALVAAKKKGPSTTMPDEYFENTSSPMHIPGSSLIYIGARDILPIFKIGPLQRIE